MQNRKLIFWGTGRIGQRMLCFSKVIGVQPDLLVDSDKDKWGICIDDVRILSPSEVHKYMSAEVLITCKSSGEIKRQLFDMGFPEKNIYPVECVESRLIELAYIRRKIDDKSNLSDDFKGVNRKVIFCLDNGAAMGGVEIWALQQEKILSDRGIDVSYILGDPRHRELVFPETHTHLITDDDKDNKIIKWIETIQGIADEGECSIIVNFAGNGLIAAAAVKILNPKIKIYAVLHSDDEVYYCQYIRYWRVIDFCFAVSKKIMYTMISRSFPKDRISVMPWHVDIQKTLEREHCVSGRLVIGYAGRITKELKRADLLVQIIAEVCKRTDDCCFKIAGIGDYLDVIKKYVIDQKLTKRVELCGQIPHNEIIDFWYSTDVAVSCSDIEGKSISLAEAMAAGNVPVVTNTSGVDDLVKNGVNGFVYSVGDVAGIVSRIIYLTENKKLLSTLGNQAHSEIVEMNREYEDWLSVQKTE